MPPSDKLPRWIDLLAALLGNQSHLTFNALAKYVPAYAGDDSTHETRKRMFERDKRELRALGVPLESVSEDGDDESAYTIRNTDFYLPYLGVVAERGVSQLNKLDLYGYRSLKFLHFQPDELQVIGDGAARVLQVGDETLADNARSAIRKLAFDLPIDPSDNTDSAVLTPSSPANPSLLSVLGDALFRRKTVAFSYHTMGAEQATSREVEPYGLFFVSGHWYLAARDVNKNGMRNFRVSRMSAVTVNTARPDTHDYTVAPEFSLRTHAASRQAWEIGDVDSYEAIVELCGSSGAALAAVALGRAHNGDDKQRAFDVRRTDSFARWLLSFAGDVMPVSPPELVHEYTALVHATRARYVSDANTRATLVAERVTVRLEDNANG